MGWFLAAIFALLVFQGCGANSAIAPAASALPETAVAKAPAPLGDRDWSDDVLYFVIVDRFADGDPANNIRVDREAKGAFHGGDLAGLRQHLDEIADLGVTAIWITPVVKNIDLFVTGAGFPDWGYHGYWADDFYAVDPRFGTEEELRGLVADAHVRGIKILLDVVYNHAGYNSRYTTDPKTRSWLRSNESGTCGNDDLTQCVSGLPDFRTEMPEVADYLMKAHIGLAQRTGLDGFRLDTLKHVDHPFWQEHRARTRAAMGEHFFLVGELWGGQADSLDPYFAPDEIDAGFDFSFQGSTLGFLQGRGRTVAFNRYLTSRDKVRPGYLLSHFLSSHDVRGALDILGGDTRLFRLAALLQFVSPGLPMIYYGEEVGRIGGDWPQNRSDMPWGDRKIEPGAGDARDESLRADYKRLIAIRRAHPALWRGTHSLISGEGDLLVFQKKDPAGADVVVVAVNRGDAAATASFPLPAEWARGQVSDIWNNENVPVANGTVSFDVQPKAARIVTIAQPR